MSSLKVYNCASPNCVCQKTRLKFHIAGMNGKWYVSVRDQNKILYQNIATYPSWQEALDTCNSLCTTHTVSQELIAFSNAAIERQGKGDDGPVFYVH